MYQGQLCKIESRDPSVLLGPFGRTTGWFMRLRTDTDTFYYLVDEDRAEELRIDLSLVDDSLANKYPARPYRVTCAVPADIQVAHMSVSKDIENAASIGIVKEKLCALKAQRDARLNEVTTASAAYKQAQEQYLKLEEAVREIEEEIVKGMRGEAMEFVYAYGKHMAGGDEYCWRVPARLKNTVKEGCTVKVDTSIGASKAVVTRIEKTSSLFDHRLVLDIVED